MCIFINIYIVYHENNINSDYIDYLHITLHYYMVMFMFKNGLSENNHID